MNPNDIRIRRVFTRKKGQPIADETINAGDTNEIVVEWEAGSAINALAITVSLDVVTFVISDGDNDTNPNLTFSKTATTNGVNQNTEYTEIYPIPKNTLKKPKLYRTTAVLHRTPEIISHAETGVYHAF